MNKIVNIKLWRLVGIIILILGIFSLVITKVRPTNPPDYSSQQQEIDSLNTAILISKSKNKVLKDSIQKFKDKILVLSKDLDSIDHKIEETREYYDNKIKNITNYSSTELGEFFSNRYK